MVARQGKDPVVVGLYKYVCSPLVSLMAAFNILMCRSTLRVFALPSNKPAASIRIR